MTSPPPDWLDLPGSAVAKLKVQPEYAQALTALRALSPKQRLFLDALLDCQLEPNEARKLLKARHGITVTRATWQRKWMLGDPNFAQAMRSLQDFACSSVAVSKAAVFAKLNRLIEDCRKVVPYTDKAGNSYERPVDAGTAHSALVTLAKLSGALSAERPTSDHSGPTYVLQIIGSQGAPAGAVIQGESIDVTPTQEIKDE